MKSVQKLFTNYKSFFLFCIMLNSCNLSDNKGYCEAFNFKRIPFNSDYYEKTLVYVSDSDTLSFEISDVFKSKSYKLDRFAWYCAPEFSVDRKDKNNEYIMNHSFNYSLIKGENHKTTLFLSFHYSSINLSVDSIASFKDKPIELSNFKHLGKENDKFVKNAVLKNMYLTEIEENSGRKWFLLKIGDSLVNNDIQTK